MRDALQRHLVVVTAKNPLEVAWDMHVPQDGGGEGLSRSDLYAKGVDLN